MKTKTMKPETLARRVRERREAAHARTAELRRRLEEKVVEEGPDSIWAEMLEDLLDSVD